MKRWFLSFIAIFVTFSVFANDLSTFQNYRQEANRAFEQGDSIECFRITEQCINHFKSHYNKFIKNKDICRIVFESYSTLAFLNKEKNKEEVCNLLEIALSLIEANPSWLQKYPKKRGIIDNYIILIGYYHNLGKDRTACLYNEKMIDFAEKHYRYEIAYVLFSACSMYSLLNIRDKSISLYQRLYQMFDTLDKYQQYLVVSRLIHNAFTEEKYTELIELATKHEELIVKSHHPSKQTIIDLISMGFKRSAVKKSQECSGIYSTSTDEAFKRGYKWILKNNPNLFPYICIEYAYWLYRFKEQTSKAVELFEVYLQTIENINQKEIFDSNLRPIEDAENAIISILVYRILQAQEPSSLNSILNTYPRVVTEIKNSPQSRYYKDFIKTIELAKEILLWH